MVACMILSFEDTIIDLTNTLTVGCLGYFYLLKGKYKL